MEPVRNDRVAGGLIEWLAASLEQPNPSRPTVTLSYAQSIDGSIAARRGERLVLSSPESFKLAHQLRAMHDAILVGVNTVISDDPQLNVRLVEGKDPQIVVLDSRLRTPVEAKILKGRPMIFCTSAAEDGAQIKLEQAGAVVERQTENQAARVFLPGMLARLKETGSGGLMVEGGGEVIASFLAEGLVDKAVITISPQFVGGYTIPRMTLGSLPKLINEKVEKFGKDFVVWGELEK